MFVDVFLSQFPWVFFCKGQWQWFIYLQNSMITGGRPRLPPVGGWHSSLRVFSIHYLTKWQTLAAFTIYTFSPLFLPGILMMHTHEKRQKTKEDKLVASIRQKTRENKQHGGFTMAWNNPHMILKEPVVICMFLICTLDKMTWNKYKKWKEKWGDWAHQFNLSFSKAQLIFLINIELSPTSVFD